MSHFEGRNVLITGGVGFVGSNLARALVQLGANVTLVDSLNPDYGGNLFNIQDIRDNVDISISDIRDPDTMLPLVCDKDYIFNLAAQTSHVDSMSDPRADLDINAEAQLTLLEACRRSNREVKIVFGSTRQLYGKPDYLPVDEKHPVRPVDVNGINRFAGECYHVLYNDVYGIRACSLRLTNTYGPGMRVKDARQNFLGIWIRLLIEGKPIVVFGDGSQVRDFDYVSDSVEAFLLAGASDVANGKVYNIGGGEVINLKSLAETLVLLGVEMGIGAAGYELAPFPPERKAIDIGDYYADFSLVSRELGWRPTVTLRAGLQRTIEYYRLHHRHYWGS